MSDTYTILIAEKNWECGDGCCHDTWYELGIIRDSDEKVMETHDHVRNVTDYAIDLLVDIEDNYFIPASHVNIIGHPWEPDILVEA